MKLMNSKIARTGAVILTDQPRRDEFLETDREQNHR
jgi:hypothetical protein